MKPIPMILFALLNLACLTNAMVTAEAVTIATPTHSTPTLAASATATFRADVCALVVADDRLYLRDRASGNVIAWLKHDDQVTVISNQGNWWKIKTVSKTGYARSTYLQIVECEK